MAKEPAKFTKPAQLNGPNSPEAEKAVIAALLTKPDAAAYVLSHVIEEDFTEQQNKAVLLIAAELYVKQKPIDMVTVSVELRKQFTGYLRELPVKDLFKGQFTGNYPEHVSVLKDLTRRRRILAQLDEAREKIATAKDCDSLVAQLVGDLVQSASDKVKRPVSLEKALILSLKRIEKAMANPGKVTGIPTGYARFDEMTGGIHLGDVAIVGARPSVGKSALLAGIADNTGVRGNHSMIVNAEMYLEDVGTRMLAGRSGVENFNLRKGQIDNDELVKVNAAFGELAKLPIAIYDDRRWSIIKTQIRAQKQADPQLKMILIDYIQRIEVGLKKDEKRYEALGRISKESADMAKDLGLAFVIAAQIDRAIEKEKRAPRMSDLRESGDIEQDADVVTFLHRFDPKDRTKVHWIIDKNRHGPVGSIPLKYLAWETRFYDWEEYQPTKGVFYDR